MHRTQTEADGGRLLCLRDLTVYLSCSRSHAQKLMDEGKLPSLKLAGIRRVRKSDVDELIERELSATKG
jgi:excisionase family DNA binding protein